LGRKQEARKGKKGVGLCMDKTKNFTVGGKNRQMDKVKPDYLGGGQSKSGGDHSLVEPG